MVTTMNSALHTVIVVAGSMLFISAIHAFSKWLRRQFPDNRVMEYLTRERGVTAKPDTGSLRAGLK